MASEDDDRSTRHENGSSRRRKRSGSNLSVEDEDLNRKKRTGGKRNRIKDDDDDDSDQGETEFAETTSDEKKNDPQLSLEKKIPKTKIDPIARKQDSGGKDDVTSRSSSNSRLISSILNRVKTTRSSPPDVRSSRPPQDTTHKDKASKVPKKSKAAEVPKSLLANMSMRPMPQPNEEIPKPKPAPRPSGPRSDTNFIKPNSRIPRSSQEGRPKEPRAAPSAPVQPPPSVGRSRAYNLVKAAVVKNLQELCNTSKLVLPPNTTRQRIDLAGTFLPVEESQDFFDRNEAGEIVLKPRQPIFPEEFPSGMPEHDLSWWGVVDPKTEIPPPEKNHHRSDR